MPLTRHPLTDQHKREICSWRYPEPYSAYNLPPYETMREKQSGFMNPEREGDYHGFSIDNVLVGYVNLRKKPDGIFVGVGVHPNHCDQGIGRQILKMIMPLCPDQPMYLEVRTWNLRAIRCYQRAGFRITGEPFEQTTGAGKGEFYRMTRA